MPTSDDLPLLGADGEPVEPAKPAEPAAAPVDMTAIRGVIAESVSVAVGEAMRQFLAANRRDEKPAEPAIDDVPDETIEAAFAEGKGAALVRRMAKAEATRATRELRTSSVDPLTTTGVRALASLTKAEAVRQMTHYERFKPQIDAAIAELEKNNPQAALDVSNLTFIHDTIVGRNWKSLEAEVREEERRRETKDDAGQEPGTTSRGGKPRGKGKSGLRPEDVLPPEALAALDDLGSNVKGRPKGRTWEEFCAMIGRDPDEYLEKIKNFPTTRGQA